MNNYKQELNLAQELAIEASNAIRPIYYGRMDVTMKADQSPVTNADVLANEIIQRGIQKAFPLDGIVSEELAAVEGNRVWYLDPIDGTRGFVEHSDQFAIHIGLAVDNKAVMGVVYKPATGEMYYADKDSGAYVRSPLGDVRKLQVQEHPYIIAAMDKGDTVRSLTYQRIEKALDIKRTLISGSEGLRIMKVAEGIADAHFTVDPQTCSTWDVCAPLAIAEEAGAYICFSDGTAIEYLRQTKLGKTFVVASSKELGERIRSYLDNRKFYDGSE